jgi:hypothetical protein
MELQILQRTPTATQYSYDESEKKKLLAEIQQSSSRFLKPLISGEIALQDRVERVMYRVHQSLQPGE